MAETRPVDESLLQITKLLNDGLIDKDAYKACVTALLHPPPQLGNLAAAEATSTTMVVDEAAVRSVACCA